LNSSVFIILVYHFYVIIIFMRLLSKVFKSYVDLFYLNMLQFRLNKAWKMYILAIFLTFNVGLLNVKKMPLLKPTLYDGGSFTKLDFMMLREAHSLCFVSHSSYTCLRSRQSNSFLSPHIIVKVLPFTKLVCYSR